MTHAVTRTMVSKRWDGSDESPIGSTRNQYFCILLPNEGGREEGRDEGRGKEEKGGREGKGYRVRRSES